MTHVLTLRDLFTNNIQKFENLLLSQHQYTYASKTYGVPKPTSRNSWKEQVKENIVLPSETDQCDTQQISKNWWHKRFKEALLTDQPHLIAVLEY